MIEFALRTIVAYLLGSLNGALLLGRLRGVDIRTQGSGNAGGTNALRTQGPLFAIGVIIIDVAKAWIAVKYVPGDAGPGMWLAATCGFAAVFGHVYPIFHGFRGGKGVATVLGTLLALSPLLLAGVLAIWFVMMFAAGAMPLLVLWAAYAGTIGPSEFLPLLWFGVVCALFVVWTHRSNIARMRNGTEPRAKRLWLLGRLRK